MQENLVSCKEGKENQEFNENQESEEIYSNTYIYGNNCECVDFKSALKYYISEQFSDLNEFSKLSGISISSLYSYENGDRKISSDRLCIICLALKLHPSRQRYLFSLTDIKMPDAGYHNSARKKIIRNYLDGCYYSEKYTIENCNKELISKGEKSLSASSEKGGVR